jgi:hypothetical protein
MIGVPTITQDELVRRIKAKLESKPHSSGYSHFDVAPAPTEPAAYVLILGAGFSKGVVPLVSELMKETIGDYYYPDQDMSSLERPAKVLRKNSAKFWAAFNEAAVKEELQIVELDGQGLPENPGAAYQCLFAYEVCNAMFAQRETKEPSRSGYLKHLRQNRQVSKERPEVRQNTGEQFVKGFLHYVLAPGAEHGWGSTGRSDLNSAHIYLVALLEAQQLGRGWTTSAFCRTLFTTNFDTLLQNGLQMVNLLYRLTDRPERGLDCSEFRVEEGPIHLVYAHGSILRHNPASTIWELSGLEKKNVDLLRDYLESRDVIAIGYSGWNDGLMAALNRCDSSKHMVYWCDILPQPASHVAAFLEKCVGNAAYVRLSKVGGADALMRALFEGLILPEAQRDPFPRYRAWNDLVWNR